MVERGAGGGEGGEGTGGAAQFVRGNFIVVFCRRACITKDSTVQNTVNSVLNASSCCVRVCTCFVHHHVYSPAQFVRGFTLDDLLETPCRGHRCLPFPPVHAAHGRFTIIPSFQLFMLVDFRRVYCCCCVLVFTRSSLIALCRSSSCVFVAISRSMRT